MHRSIVMASSLFCLLLLGLADARSTLAQDSRPESAQREREAVSAALQHYLQAHATGDGSHHRKVFHPEARLFWVRDGKLTTRTSEEYIAGAPGSPAEDEARRSRRVTMIDVTGDAAVARVVLDYPGALITDYMSLLEIDGEWRIVNKIFHVGHQPADQGRSPAATSSALDQDRPPRQTCDGEHRASDYVLGRWIGTVMIPNPDGSLVVDRTVSSEAEFTPVADGCALVERRTVRRDGNETAILTVRAYDPDGEDWHQLLVSTRPVVLRFTGERSSSGDLRFVTARPGGEELVRVTDRRIESGGFNRIIEASSDGGRTWTLEDVVEYRRP